MCADWCLFGIARRISDDTLEHFRNKLTNVDEDKTLVVVYDGHDF